jgi:hypothetical protein
MFAPWFKALRAAATAAVSACLVNPGLGDSNSAARAKRGFPDIRLFRRDFCRKESRFRDQVCVGTE